MKNIFVVLLLLLLAIPVAHSQQRGGGSHPLLSPLIAPLDGHVDVIVQRDREKAKVLLPGGHVLTWMDNMPRTTRKPRAPYVPEGVILAVQPSGQVGPEPVPPGRLLALTEFYEEWLRAAPGRRVFISYARADAQQAVLVEKTMRQQGFVTFIYLADDGKPKIPLIKEQQLFKTADVHLVLHSRAARRSIGVKLERWAFEEVMAKRAKQPKVHVFGQPGCGRTMLTLGWFDSQGIRAEFVDIDRSLDARRRARQRNIKSLPMVEIDGEPFELPDEIGQGCRFQ